MPKRMTKEEFVTKAVELHGDRYDYSKVEYVNNRVRVEIICSLHGSFWQTPHDHLGHNGHGCPRCKGEQASKMQRKDQTSFIREAQLVHGNKYDYSKTKYKGNKVKVEIVCPTHGSFWQSPVNHLFQFSGCYKCGKERMAKTNTKDQDTFIKECIAVYRDRYDYSKVVYTGGRVKVEIICQKHGSFLANPHDFIGGHGCPDCGKEQKAAKKTKKQDVFIQEAQATHGNMYDYSKAIYRRTNVKVDIICPQHGSFWQSPQNHIQQKQGCPVCSFSQGELRIFYLLKSWRLHFTHQKRFSACRNKKMLPFDFYFRIGKLQFLVEYDGPHHFQDIQFYAYQGNFEETQRRDAIKTKFAQDHNFILIRIPYTEYDRIETILREAIEQHTGQPFTPTQFPARPGSPGPLQGNQLSFLNS